MALPNTFFLFMLFLFFHFCFFMSSTTNAASALINQVCSHTQSRDFCVRTLTSEPGANDISTLTGLDRLSLTFTNRAAYENENFIDQSLATETNSGVKRVLQHCQINYKGSIAALDQAITNLDARQFQELNVNTHISLENSNDCDRVIKQGPPPPGLQDKNKQMLQLTDISIAIADLLSRP